MSNLLKVSALSSQRTLLVTTALAAMLAVAGSTAGHAAGANAQIIGNGFSGTPIKVISENGTSWTKIEERTLGLPVKIDIEMAGHYVMNYGVKQKGQPDGQHIFYHTNDVDQVHSSPTLNGTTQNMTAAERQVVIAECNKKLNQGDGIHQDHNVFTGVGVILAARFEDNGIFGDPLDASGTGVDPHIANANVTVPVQCAGVKKLPAGPGGVTAEAPDFKVKDINLRFMTSANYVTQPDPATRCKLTQVRVRVGATKAGPTKFKLWTKVGNEPAKSEVVDAWASFAGPGKFEATFTKPVPVTKTTNVQAMAEDMVNPIGLTTPWKSITVHCTGAGGGGFAGNPSNANPDGFPPRPPQVRPPFGGRPGGLVNRPHPTHDAAPQRGALVKLKAETYGRPVFGADRFQRTKVHVR
jgi:hypothetical protein